MTIRYNKRGEITFYKIFAGLVLLSMVSVGLVSFMTELVSNYEVDGATPLTSNETEVYGSFNILANLSTSSSSLSTDVEHPGQGELTDTSFFILAPTKIWSAIQVVWELPIFIFKLGNKISEVLHLPYWVMLGINVLVVTLIAFLVLSAVIKWRLQ